MRRLGTAMLWLVALPWVVVPLNAPLAEHRLYGPLRCCSYSVSCWVTGAVFALM